MAIVDRLKIDQRTPVWFTMQATFNREVLVQEYLNQKEIESFIPMQYVMDERGKSKKMILSPVVKNLLFIKASITTIKELRNKFTYLQFKRSLENSLYIPTIVPTKQMEDFVRLYNSTHLKNLSYLSPDDPNLKKAETVRLHQKGGALDGIVGKLVKIEGRRNKHLSIRIGENITIAAPFKVDLIEVIK